jgi:hypothetical protein
MYDHKTGTAVTFNAIGLPVPNDPDTYEDHLEFASWYHAVTSSRRVNRNVRAEAKGHLSKYDLSQLRAIFLYALFENAEELKKGNVLDPLERARMWDRLEFCRHIDYDNDGIPFALDSAKNLKFEN